jgi:hypothetical protein
MFVYKLNPQKKSAPTSIKSLNKGNYHLKKLVSRSMAESNAYLNIIHRASWKIRRLSEYYPNNFSGETA